MARALVLPLQLKLDNFGAPQHPHRIGFPRFVGSKQPMLVNIGAMNEAKLPQKPSNGMSIDQNLDVNEPAKGRSL